MPDKRQIESPLFERNRKMETKIKQLDKLTVQYIKKRLEAAERRGPLKDPLRTPTY